MKKSRNQLCPCGSGKKYKNCCLAKDERQRKSETEQSINGQKIMDELYDEFEGRGPAQAMTDFAQPLIDEVAKDEKELSSALSLAHLFWNFALIPDEKERQAQIDDFLSSSSMSEKEKEDFRKLAWMMIERHRQMFPKLHKPDSKWKRDFNKTGER